MRILSIIAMLLLVGGIALTGLCAYTYFNNEDRARAEQYSAEQEKLLAEAMRNHGTPKEKAAMKEYEEGKGVTELAWEHARQTRQTIIFLAAGGLVLIVVAFAVLMASRKKIKVQPV
jgi:hypothetical protein